MKIAGVLAVIVCATVANFASADTIHGIDIDFVTIDNAGNPGDTRTETDEYGRPIANPYGCGAVSYNYRIGKYEVTNAQWNTFTAAASAPNGNNGGYNYSSYYTGVQQPTNRVSWYEAAQFCNYLTSGDKSKGAYQFSGNNTNPGNFLGIDRVSSISTYGTTYVIPTEDEWYKAAYYKPDGSGYSTYANGTNTIPSTSEACYGQSYPRSGPWNVGTGTQEQNGTFDMMGNVFELNETFIDSSNRCIRGGSYLSISNGFDLKSSDRSNVFPYTEGNNGGFRVASVPEPATIVLLTLGGLGLRRKNK
jgi:sulfatase modifying factor 1